MKSLETRIKKMEEQRNNFTPFFKNALIEMGKIEEDSEMSNETAFDLFFDHLRAEQKDEYVSPMA